MEGLDGLYDRPRSGRPRLLNAEQEAEVKAAVLAGPHIEKDGPSAFTLEDIRRMIEERRRPLSLQPRGRADASHGAVAAEGATEPSEERRGRGGALQTGAPELERAEELQLHSRARASASRSGSRTRRGSARKAASVTSGGSAASSPLAPAASVSRSAYIFAAAKIGSDDAFALVMPEANTGTMHEFLDRFSMTLPKDEVAVMYADQAGCHVAKELRIPDNVILLALPAYSPEPNTGELNV